MATSDATTEDTIYALTRSWDEASVTWMNANAAEPWTLANSYFTGFPGQLGGGEFDKTTGVVTSGIGAEAWFNTDVSAMARTWVSTPASNNGCIVQGNYLNKTDVFASKEYTESSQRPILTVTYETTALRPVSAMISGVRAEVVAGGLRLMFPHAGAYSLSLHNAEGQRLASVRGMGSVAEISRPGLTGMVFATVEFEGQTVTRKVMMAR